MTKKLVLRNEDSKLTLETKNNDLFTHFKEWLLEYVDFSKTEETQFTIHNSADMLKCRLKALRMGFQVTIS